MHYYPFFPLSPIILFFLEWVPFVVLCVLYAVPEYQLENRRRKCLYENTYCYVVKKKKELTFFFKKGKITFQQMWKKINKTHIVGKLYLRKNPEYAEWEEKAPQHKSMKKKNWNRQRGFSRVICSAL